MIEHVMVDLETKGVTPGCMILSIGAVRFNPANGDIDLVGFYEVVDQAEEYGLHTLHSTMEWWDRQSPEARKVFTASSKVLLSKALRYFNDYLPPSCFVWGNGADFDNAILAAAYRATGVSQGWKPYNGRCYRTIKNLAPQVRMKTRQGVHHNALDDARAQAQHLLDIVEYTSLTLA